MGAIDLVRKGLKAIAPHRSEILLAVGIAGFGATIYMVAKASPEAKNLIDHIKVVKSTEDIPNSHLDKDDRNELIKEDAKEIVKLYLPAAAMGGLTLACFIAGNRMQHKQIAVLSSAYAISENTLRSYQAKVIEDLGEEAHQKVIDRIAQDEAPFDEDYSYKVESDGSILCYDRVTGRYFKSDKETIRSAESIVLKKCIDETRATLNDFYAELGLSDNSFIGDAIGWDIGKVRPDVYFTSMLNKESEPCLVLNYNVCVIDSRIFGNSNLAYY